MRSLCLLASFAACASSGCNLADAPSMVPTSDFIPPPPAQPPAVGKPALPPPRTPPLELYVNQPPPESYRDLGPITIVEGASASAPMRSFVDVARNEAVRRGCPGIWLDTRTMLFAGVADEGEPGLQVEIAPHGELRVTGLRARCVAAR